MSKHTKTKLSSKERLEKERKYLESKLKKIDNKLADLSRPRPIGFRYGTTFK